MYLVQYKPQLKLEQPFKKSDRFRTHFLTLFRLFFKKGLSLGNLLTT